MPTSPTIAYLAEGKLYLRDADSSPRLIESDFAQQLLDRASRSRQKNEWKSQGMGWKFGVGGIAAMAEQVPAEMRRIRHTGLCNGSDGQYLYYALDTDYVGGLFEFDLKDGYERRLFHRNQFRAADLSRHPQTGMLAFSLANEDGTASVGLLQSDGRGLRQVTEGDCVDEAPTWVQGDSKLLVFQSAGVGRNAAGFRISLSPYAIQKLDLDNQEMTTLLEDDSSDYLMPRMTADGTLYCIRRPYEPHGQPASPWKVAIDILLFPIRLIRAIVHFLNFFSLMFSRKPLMIAGGPPDQSPDARYMMLFGKLIDAEKLLRKSDKSAQGALVPKSWQLIRRRPDSDPQTLATGVVAFDLCADGSIIYTNGTTIFHLTPSGESQELCQGRLIERVIAVSA